MATQIADELLTRNEAAAFLRMQPQTLALWSYHKRGPAYLKCGRAVRYRRSDLDLWLKRIEPAAAAV